MKRMKKAFTLLLAALLLGGVLTPAALAASTAEPTLTVLVKSPPADLTLSARFADGSAAGAIPLEKTRQMWETAFRLFLPNYAEMTRATSSGMYLLVQSGGQTLDYQLPRLDYETYNNVITFNYADKTFTMGPPAGRSLLLVAVRVALALLLEALVFLAFGYRKLKSWIVFLVTNLIAQGALYALLIYKFGASGSFAVIPVLLVAGFVMIVAEALIYIKALKEQADSRAIAFAVVSNIAGLILGIVMTSYLPTPL